MIDHRRVSAILFAILFLAAPAFLQVQPGRHIHGRVRSAAAANGVFSAKVSLVVRRGDQDLKLSETSTDAHGRFRLKSGVLSEQPLVRIHAAGLAPRQLRAKKLVQGEGLLLPDVFLDRGVPVLLAVDAETAAAAPVWLLVFPLTDDERIIDIDGPALIKSRFDQEGRLTVPHVAPGLYGFVVTDHFARFRPELIVWRVGQSAVTLPPFVLRVGNSTTMTMVAGVAREIEGQLLAGFGRWHPDGGGEYRFRHRIKTNADKQGNAKVNLAHLPPSVCDVQLASEKNVARHRFLPGSGDVEVSWLPASSVAGQISVPFGKAKWDEVFVQVGIHQAQVGKSGQFFCGGLHAGSHKVLVHVPGYPTLTHKRVVLADSEERNDLDLSMTAGAEVDGETRNEELKRSSYIWVGYDSVESDPRYLGQYFQGISDANGDFELNGVRPGSMRFYLRPPQGFVSRQEHVDLDDGISAIENLRFDLGGTGGGTILDGEKKPVVGARVRLAAISAPLSHVVGDNSGARLTNPVIHETVTDKKGEYQFSGIRPDVHALIVSPEGLASSTLGTVNVTSGANPFGFDWQIDSPQSTVIDLPQGIPYQLRSSEHEHITRWLYREPGTGPLVVSGLPRGVYEVEPLAAHVSAWPYATRALDYVEWRRDRIQSLVSIPAIGAVARATAVPALVLQANELRILINGDLPGPQERVELTAYPLSAARPLQPVRLEYPAELRSFKVELPRGVWLIKGRSANGSVGSTGPISVGRGFENPKPEPIKLSLMSPAAAFGFVDLSKGESEEEEGVYVTASDHQSDLIQPWTTPERRSPVSETGNIRIDDLPAGPSTLRVFGPTALIDVPLESRSFELKDLKRIVPGLPAAVSLDLKDESLIDGSMTGALGRVPLKRRATYLPGGYIFGTSPSWDRVQTNGIHFSEQVVTLQSGDILIGGADLLRRGRGSLRSSIRVDGVALPHWPVTLLPIQNDAHDVSRPILRSRSNEQGELNIRGVAHGGYAFYVRYLDDAGRVYQLALPLYLNDRTRVTNQDVRIRTRTLTVIAYDQSDGEAGENALVRVLRTDLRGLGDTTVFRRQIEEITRGVTDNTGEIIFRSLPIGTYDVVVSRRGRVTSVIKGVDLGSGSGAVLVRAKGLVGHGTTVELVDGEKAPIVGAEFFLYSKDGVRVHGDVQLTSDANGRVYLADLETGSYQLHVQAQGFPAQRLTDIVIDPKNEKIQSRIAHPGANLEIQCINDEGHRISGVKVFVVAENENWQLFGHRSSILDERLVDVNRNGIMELRNVPQGECKLRAVHDGFQTFIGTTQVRSSKRNEFQMVLKRKL